MKKYSEQDIEKMLFNTEKTDASFDKKVNFPANNIIYKRRRFTSLLVAACLVVFIVSGSLIVAFVQNGGDNTEFSNNIFISENDPDISGENENSIGNTQSNASGFESFPYDNSETGDDISHEDETRNPFGESENSEGSNTSDNVSQGEPLLPQIMFPNDNAFFSDNGTGNLTAEEYFASNPYKNLKGKSKLSIYSRNMLSVDERKEQIKMFGKSFGFSLTFDEQHYKSTGDCRGVNNDNGFIVNVSQYGDWYIDSSTDLLYIGAPSYEISAEIQKKVNAFIKEHQDVFGNGAFKITHKFSSGKLEVFLYENADDKVIANTPQFVLTFKVVGTNDFYLTTVERKIANMKLLGEYPILSYSEALKEFFKQPITEDESENENLECVLVGYDVRYLFSSKYECMYPYYAFVIKFDPNGENPRYKAFFVPAIEAEYIAKAE